MKHLIRALVATALLVGAVGTSTSGAVVAAAPAPAPTMVIGAGTSVSYVITADGKPYGTGDNSNGELTGSSDTKSTLSPLIGLPAGVRATAVSGGYNHTMVLGSNGVAYGTGDNLEGQLTGSTSRSVLTPMAGLPAGVKATAVAAGGDHSLVLGSDGVPYAAGRNSVGQLTGPSGVDKATLTAMTGLPSGVKAVAIATSPNNSLVLGSNGTAYGSGMNTTGQLAFPNSANQTTLVPLGGLPVGVTATAVSSGAAFSLVLGSDHIAYGAGNNSNNQLTGVGNKNILAPLTGLPGTVKAAAIAAGGYHSLVIGTNGLVYGAGYNHEGALTGDDGANRMTLTLLTGLPAHVTATAIAADELTSVVLGSDHVVYGAGGNAQAQLTGAASKKYVLTPFAGQQLTSLTGPALSKSLRVGRQASVSRGTWLQAPTTFAFQWRRNGSAIAGATKAKYTPIAADLGKSLSVRVTVTRPGFVTGARTTTAVKVARGAAPRLAAKDKPKIIGTAKVGNTLKVGKVTRAAWTPNASTVTYQWFRGSKPIKHATTSAYKLTKADQGTKLKVRVYGTRPGCATGTSTSTSTSTATTKVQADS